MPSLEVDLLENHIILCTQGPVLYNDSDLEEKFSTVMMTHSACTNKLQVEPTA